MSKKNTNQTEVHLCIECGKPLRATNSNVHSECLELALKDTEFDFKQASPADEGGHLGAVNTRASEMGL